MSHSRERSCVSVEAPSRWSETLTRNPTHGYLDSESYTRLIALNSIALKTIATKCGGKSIFDSLFIPWNRCALGLVRRSGPGAPCPARSPVTAQRLESSPGFWLTIGSGWAACPVGHYLVPNYFSYSEYLAKTYLPYFLSKMHLLNPKNFKNSLTFP